MKHLKDFIIESQLELNGFCILKPGFLDHQKEWEDLLKNRNWNIIQKQRKKLNKEEAEELYKMHSDKEWYKDLIEYMTSDDCLCCSCYKDCNDPIKDMKDIKHQVRDTWGEDEMRNGMHSSDSIENVSREINIALNKIPMNG